VIAFLAGSLFATEPSSDDTSDRVIFYLHGKIVEDQGADAKSARFGRYEYDAILQALGRDGHRVVSEVREPETDPREYARKVVVEIEELKRSGVPAGNITVVGASKGAAIAALVSHLLKDADVHYVLLAICNPQMLERWEAQGVCLTGSVLSFFDRSDEFAGSCAELAARCESGIAAFEEIELSLGKGHGMVYRPFEEWVAPTLEWSAGPAGR
jgi:hypothetical protein